MAIITSFQQNKKQKYLFFLLGIVILGVIFFVWNKYIFKPKPPLNVPPPKTIDINFELFGDPTLVNIQPFEESILPSPEAEAVSLNPTLSWEGVPEAEKYLWEVVGVESGNTKETSVTVSKRLKPSTTYIWRVKACKEDMSECSLWSNRTFTTSLAFISPGLISPQFKEIFIQGRENPFTPYETGNI